jgi:hypothetical protein
MTAGIYCEGNLHFERFAEVLRGSRHPDLNQMSGKCRSTNGVGIVKPWAAIG